MQKYNDVVLRSNGSTSRPVAGATITVTQFPSGAAATIYSDNGVTPITSLVSDATGAYAFYAADGRYNITVSGAGFTTKTLTDVLIEDPADGAVVSTGVSVTTKGDLQGFSTVAARIPVGTNGQQLIADSTQTTGLKWASEPTVFGIFYPGVPTASALVGSFAAPSGITTLTFAAAIAGSSGKAFTAATAQTDFDVRKNATTSSGGSSVGTIRFAAAGTVPTFIAASGFTLTGGTDYLSVWAPATPDATLANIAASLFCTRS